MPIDSSIALGVRPQVYQAPDPLEQAGKSLALQGLMGQQELHGLQTQIARKGIADDEATSSAYQQAGGDNERLRALLYGAGQHKAVQALDKFNLEKREKESTIGKNTAQGEKARIDAAKEKYTLMGNAFGFVRQNPTQDNAYRAIDSLVQSGVMSAEEGAKAKQTTPADPEQIKALADQHWQSVLSAKDQLEKFETRNTGGQTQTIGIDPVTGKTRVVNTVTNTQSPDSVASNATTQRGQNMTQATAQRGQDITDTRERDIPLAGRKAEAGVYGRERGEATAQAQINLPTVTANAERGIKLIDDLIGTSGKTLAPGEKSVAPHPGFSGAVGASGLDSGFGAAGFIPGTDTTDFKRRLDEIKGGAFMQAFQSLRGGGAITEKEGEKATSAITRMDKSQSEKEFVTAAREFQDVVRKGLEKAKAQAASTGSAQFTQSDIDAELRKRGVIR